jgi:hypothetical protein
MAHQHLLNDEMRRCIQDCHDCNRICVETVTHCTTMGGKHVQGDHLRTLLDCAEICATASGFMLRASQYAARLCGACAEVCAACADSCQQIDPHDRTMQQCADTCRRCAESCRKMSGAAA